MAQTVPSVEKYSIDATDLQILRELQRNARLTTKELAARVNLSTTPVFERVKRLERDGIIDRYSTCIGCGVGLFLAYVYLKSLEVVFLFAHSYCVFEALTSVFVNELTS